MSDSSPSPATLGETLTREQIIATARELFGHYGWNNSGDFDMRQRIEKMRDMALSALSETACIRIPRSLAERTEAMFRSVDPQGFIALEWANALTNGGVSPADAGAPLPGSTPGASFPSATRTITAQEYKDARDTFCGMCDLTSEVGTKLFDILLKRLRLDHE